MNFRAFHSTGLWLAVTTMPPSSRINSTASWAVGVGTIPRSTTSMPARLSPADAAATKPGPDWRESRARATVRPPRAATKAPNATP